jgi:hypothetical protein
MEFALIWFGLLVAGAAIYVSLRSSGARRRGEDGFEAGKRAVWEALPVLGAGLAGLGVFFVVGLFLVFVLVMLGLGAVLGGDPSGAGGFVAVLLLGGLAALFGLPLAALAIVVAVQRRRRAASRR